MGACCRLRVTRPRCKASVFWIAWQSPSVLGDRVLRCVREEQRVTRPRAASIVKRALRRGTFERFREACVASPVGSRGSELSPVGLDDHLP